MNHLTETPSQPGPRKKRPLDIDEVLRRASIAVQRHTQAALFELADEGFDTVFEQLVACIISIRTLDEVTLTVSRRLFQTARRPADFLGLSPSSLDKLLSPCTFHEQKSYRILEIARQTQTEYNGELPCDFGVLTSFKGVGPKCANLVLGTACQEGRIAVDTHVHRISNRLGYVQTKTPEKTLAALELKLPRRHWREINRLFVPFGKHICTPSLPRCSTCPVADMCRQVGVTRHR